MSSFRNTILITGGAGYIGSHIAFLLQQQRQSVVLIDNLSQGQSWPNLPVPMHYGDCGDYQFMKKMFHIYGIKAVIHCAASIEVSESFQKPLLYYRNNVAATINILQLMSEFQVSHFIFSSSCSVYGTPEYVPMTEEHPKSPLSPYATSKLMAEKVIQDAVASLHISYVIFRYFNAAGALAEYGLGEQHTPETHVIPRLLECAYSGAPFMLYGSDYATPDGSCMRDYTHVIDIAHGHIKALEYLAAEGVSEIFNLGTGKGVSVLQLIQAVEHVTQKKIKVIFAPRREGDSPVLVAETSKAHSILQWQPKRTDLKEIVQSAATFYSLSGKVARAFFDSVR